MTKRIRRHAMTGVVVAAILSLTACNKGGAGPNSIAGKTPSGQIELRAVQAAYIGSASTGTGTLLFNGGTYPFNISGAGIGGIGASTIDGDGEVYNLPSAQAFPGAYAQGRYGFAIGDTSRGDLWLQNDAGVIIHIKAKRQGLMLTLGGDAMVISFQ